MKKLLLLGLFFSLKSFAGGSPILWSGDNAYNILSGLCMGTNACLISGSLDPSSVAVNAPQGSLYLSTSGNSYLKQDAGLSTNWDLLASGIIPLASGGTNASLTASNGAIPYSTTTAFALLAPGTSGQLIQSGGAGAPNWTTATYPSSTTANQILYSSATNVVGQISSANTSALVTNGSGVPSLTSGTTPNRVLRTDGSAVTFSQVALATDVSGTLPVANATISTQAISASDINWNSGNVFTKTLGANTTFTFSNQISGQTVIVRLTNTASNYTVTWPTVRWMGGAAPTMTVGAKSDVYTFFYDGSNTYGSYVQDLY